LNHEIHELHEKSLNFVVSVKSKKKMIFTAVCAGLLAGCSTSKEAIQFNDERLPEPTNAAANAALPQPPRQEKADLLKLEAAVYGYLLQRHFWDAGGYSAIFLQADDAEVAAIKRTFPNHVPPIKAGYRAGLRPGRTPVDKDTGKPAMILSVDVSEPEGNTVAAIGRWYAGDAVTGFYTFELKKNGAEWVIESAK
jgi:hypothetical protein